MKETDQGCSDDDEVGKEKLENISSPESVDTASNNFNGNGSLDGSLHTKAETCNHSIEGVATDPLIVNEQSISNHRDESDVVVKEKRLKKVPNTCTKDDDSPTEPSRRSSTRLQGKRPKLTELVTTSDEEDYHDTDDDISEEEVIKSKTSRKRGRPPKKKGTTLHTPSKNGKEPESKKKVKPLVKEKKLNKSKKKQEKQLFNKLPKEFSSGSFVVLKTDFHSATIPSIWRIDGKALLQKYVHFEQDRQILYKNTSTYSGWTLNNRDLYYPATVVFESQNRKETVVKFKRETIVDDESD